MDHGRTLIPRQVYPLPLPWGGCGRCDFHHKIVDWMENRPRGWRTSLAIT